MPRLLSFAELLLVLSFGICDSWAQSPARQAGYLYLSPVPNASYVSAQTRYVLLRLQNLAPSQVTNLAQDFVTVAGGSSGPHAGNARVATDGKTVIFTMGTDFAEHELVTVTLNPLVSPASAGKIQPYQYQFMITAPMPGSLPLSLGAPTTSEPESPPAEPKRFARSIAPPATGGAHPLATLLPNGISVPSDFPKVVINANTNPSPGYLFLENGLDGVPPYTMMLDNNGLPVWYRRGRMYDFKIQKNRMITWCLSDDKGFPAFDQNFKYLRTYLTTNGYSSDGHELKIQPDGSYYMIGYRLNPVDMSRYVKGGSTSAIVRETIVQGFTIAGELTFQWRSWDNYDIRDATNNTDFPHLNGLDIDEDGNILVSARHLSEVTKVNRDSGDIMWRLSGAHSSFHFIDDPLNGTSFQHNISALGNGHYMVFDNGNYHVPQVSRAVEYKLDLTKMTATMVWQFRDIPDKYTYWLGNAQRLPSGNTLINFVRPQYPKAIEVDTNGTKRFELSLVPGADAYRAFRFPWTGVVEEPYLILEPQVDNITLIFNKFGDHDVAYYRIYGDTSPEPTTVIAESTATLKPLSNLPNGLYYFRVTAVSSEGVESPFSNEESINVNILAPGQNMITNGDFSLGGAGWSFKASSPAQATWSLTNGIAHVYITSGGTTLSAIQLSQSGKPLVQANTYVLEFDAWSTQSRYIDVRLVQGSSPFAVYTHISPPYLTPNRTHYRYVLTMQQPTDFNASLVFNLGASTAGVYLDNVSLFSPPVGDLNLDGRVDELDLGILVKDWLKRQPGLPGDLNGDGRVDFSDFNRLGASWSAGSH
jgi:hypothetical protein